MRLRRLTRWQRKQALAAPSRFYRDGGTIHHGTGLDVEVDTNGNVVAVWFRCQKLPFRQVHVDTGRAADMRSMYNSPMPALTGVEILDPEPGR